MKWFNNPRTLEELKKQYKQLAVKHHPDIGGSTEDMKSINAEYDLLFERLKNVHQTADGETYRSSKETSETPDDFKCVIEKLLKLKGIKIEICGSWLWITGQTFEHREALKEMGFKWSKTKSAWYFHGDDFRKSTKRSFTLDEIRDLYGSQTVRNDPQLKLAIV